MKRLFVSVPISEEVKENIFSLFDELKKVPNLKLVRKDNLHFTLKFLGEVTDSELKEIKDHLAKIEFNPFKISLSKVNSFSIGNFIKVVWIGAESEQMVKLISSVQKKFHYLRKEDHGKIIPHLTLARTNPKTDQDILKKFLDKHENDSFGETEINKIILYESELTPQGAVYRELQAISFK